MTGHLLAAIAIMTASGTAGGRITAQTATAIGTIIAPIRITDQYDAQVVLPDPGGQPVVLLYGDQKGSSHLQPYVDAALHLRDSLPAARLVVIEAAGLRGVPFFAKSRVRNQFRRPNADGSPSAPVALDWSGHIPRRFGGTTDVANIYLIDGAGRLRYRAAGQGTAVEVTELTAAIERLLAAP